MTEIEFLDPGPAQGRAPGPGADSVAPDPTPAADRRTTIRRALPTVLWVAAATLAVLAPFRLVYAISLRLPGTDHQDVRADGWGRMHASVPFAEHETRYGIVEYVAAGLVLVAAGLGAVAAYRRGLRVASAGAGLAGTALLAGVLASALLYVDSVTDNIKAEVRGGTTNFGLEPTRTLDAHLGGMVWLSAAAVGCGLASLVALAALPPAPIARTGPRYPVPAPVIATDPEPGEELLDAE
jgi:hypothetical protein